MLIIQPSELFVYPFTTGLLGLTLGIAFKLTSHRLYILSAGAASLTAGIFFVLHVLGFPLLGPDIKSVLSPKAFMILLLSSILYSGIWLMIGKRVIAMLKKRLYRAKS
ncbi:hypothetical protein [Peribacillus kribbensis]|uniref:hypothetical protein n=1 Tax=Peribacillus kribbensis TaxID=356658 RepID=UPI0006842F54|nr:hypothetical protein [Peribacillus kribbensis]